MAGRKRMHTPEREAQILAEYELGIANRSGAICLRHGISHTTLRKIIRNRAMAKGKKVARAKVCVQAVQGSGE